MFVDNEFISLMIVPINYRPMKTWMFLGPAIKKSQTIQKYLPLSQKLKNVHIHIHEHECEHRQKCTVLFNFVYYRSHDSLHPSKPSLQKHFKNVFVHLTVIPLNTIWGECPSPSWKYIKRRCILSCDLTYFGKVIFLVESSAYDARSQLVRFWFMRW